MTALRADAVGENRARRWFSRGPRLWGGLLLLVGFSIVLFPASSTSTKLAASDSAVGALSFEGVSVRAGDVVFRRGRSLLSRAVLSVDGGSEYSHVGLVHVGSDGPAIIHVLPTQEGHEVSRVVREPLQHFLDLRAATGAALLRARPEWAGAAQRAAEAAYRYVREGRSFDDGFDLATQDELYCTELVWAAYLEAGVDVTAGRLDQLEIPFAKAHYLLPSTLLRSPYLILVAEVVEHPLYSQGEDP